MWRITSRGFSKLVPKSESGGFLKAAKQKLFGRNTVYRMLLTSSIACTIGAAYLLQSKERPKNNMNTHYYQPAEVLELGVSFDYKECFLVGIIKPGTLRIEENTRNHVFVITDFIHEIKIHYDGKLPSTVREGETVRCQGEFVDEYNPTEMVASMVQGAHDSEKTKTSYQPRSKDITIKSRPME